jgi:type IV secretory pathway VirB3-like protein
MAMCFLVIVLWVVARVILQVNSNVSEKLAAVIFSVEFWKGSAVMLMSIYKPTGCTNPEDLI